MALYFSKVSGVIRVATDSGLPRTFYSVQSRVEPNTNNDTVTIYLGGSSYTELYSSIRVNNQTPSTLSEAVTLLSSLIGS